MKKTVYLIFTFALIVSFTTVFAQSRGNYYPATDALGRTLPRYKDVGRIKEDKTIALFFWTWHSGLSRSAKAYDLSKILDGHPEMINDYHNPLWDPYLDSHSFFWSEPLFGFYDGKDKWVIRKQLEMIAAAGVDVIFYDATNVAETWKTGYDAVGEVMEQMRSDGVENIPQFAFMLNFGALPTAANAMGQLYNDIYKNDKYRDFWFMWKGKPVIMAYPESLDKIGDESSTAGMEFSAVYAFDQIRVLCPSYGNDIGNLTLSIYHKADSYSASVAQTPIATETFVDFPDNADLTLTFDQLPAGDYVWELSNATELVGVWKFPDDTPETTSYYNGSPISGDYNCKINYVSEGLKNLTTGGSMEAVPIPEGMEPALKDTIRSFFTFRPMQPAMNAGPDRDDQWGWLEITPQHKYVSTGNGYELVTVGVAQNWSDEEGGLTAMNAGTTVRGRSYTTTDGFSNLNDTSCQYGYNFQEQWDRALDIDPEMIFITGWNEWVAGRFEQWPSQEAHDQIPQVGVPVDNAFPDEFSKEYSRDIEPMKGGFGDNYYYQMVANIRKFKGMKRPEPVSDMKTITIDGVFDEWDDVTPFFKSNKGNAEHRDGYGYIDPGSTTGEPLHYINNTGRNDLCGAKVARDNDYVYFYVETADDITPESDADWMRLYIDVDRDKSTGWEGYDYVVNRISPEDGKSVLESTDKKWSDYSEADKVDFAVSGNKMEIAIPRSYFGTEELDFEFKWADNSVTDGDILDFLINGDAAPLGRFNYYYSPAEDLAVNDHKIEKNFLRVRPNPFKSRMEVMISSDKYFEEGKTFVVVRDLTGQIVLKGSKKIYENLMSLNTSSLKKGVYLISFEVNGRALQSVKAVKL